MKQIFTLLSLLTLTWSLHKAEAQCNYSSGSNGMSVGSQSITMDGNMSDWNAILNDPHNNTYDGNPDLDQPLSDAGRDLVRFAFTEDASYLYMYLKRAGSSSNKVDILFYSDINNNEFMDFREPIVHIDWSGSNGNVNIAINDYQPNLNELLNSVLQNNDGAMLHGTVQYRGSAGSSQGKGSADGTAVEIKIPFSKLTTLNLLGQLTDQLTFGENFKFHVSTINGNISSIPGANSVADFGGCITAPTGYTLPVQLVNFEGNLNNRKVSLEWMTAQNETASLFEIQRSFGGANFNTVALLFASEKDGTETYTYGETLNGTGSVYYRLKMYDVDQKINYSKILAFQTQTNQTRQIKILNNPAVDKLTFSFNAEVSSMYEIRIYDITGKLQLKQSINAYKGNNSASISLSTLTKSAMHIIELNNGIERQTATFLKQ
ncbi:MAG: hypothetical protein C4329_04690 [Chitinophagaceae bacterium]